MHFHGKSAPAHLTYATSFDGDLPMPKHSRQYTSSHDGIVIVIFQVMFPYVLSVSQYVSCFNLTTWSRWTLKIKTIYPIWIVCWTQGALNLPPILLLLLVDLPQPDRSSSDTLPPLLWDNETNFAECCVFFLMNNADWMINLFTKDRQHILLYDLEMASTVLFHRMIEVFVDLQCIASLLNWNATNDDKCTSPSAA